ncbi:MAG: FTR1 family protein [Chloroflexota bacterium]
MIHAAEGQQVPVWESAETIRKLGAEAQAGLFRDNPELATMEAKIAQLSTIYADTVQSALASVAPETDRTISNAIDEARQAVTDGDGVRLALARGQLWTHLLHGSFAVTQAALDAGNVDDASEWLRLREYRRSTIVNLVSSPADAAMQQVRRGTISPIDAKLIVASDLRDTTFFRLREALNELDDAIASEFPTRAAEWVGKVQGYFALLKEDYRSKQGDEVVDAVQVQLQSAGEAALLSDWASLTAIREELSGVFANYQPIAFSEEQLAERAQLLFLYTELIWIEYRDAVRNGEISIDIEYQETITFRNQAQAVYEELRPTLAATAPADADRLADIYVELEQIIMAIGPKADVEVLVVEASELIVNGLGVDPEGNDAGAALTVIDGLLDQVITAVEAGDYEGAENARIEAYAFFETGPEVKLANRAPRLAREIEGTFWEGTQGEEGLAALISASASLEEIQTRIDTLRTRLTASEEFLNTSNTVGVTILNSAAIIIREGLEAVLIIGAIIGFMRASAESRKYIWWVGAGVMAAILLSVGIWWASFSIITISFSNRELIEGLTALVAVAVLFYVTNWLFQKVYVRDWMSYVKEQVGKALTSGSAFGLAFLGFAVVFREGFETVLFYQTLLFDSEVQPVVIGFLTGLVVILVVAYLILQMSVRLPLKPFFTVTTILLLTMAFNFMGKGIRGLQEAGYVSTTWLSWVPENLLLIELFGIYPTVETTLAQVGFVLLVLGTFGWSIYQSKQQNRVQAAVAN